MLVRRLALALGCAAVLGVSLPAVAADAFKNYTRKGASYNDVRLDLEDAIISVGLKIDYNGKIGEMLVRTGPDVGSNQPIFKNAEFFTFCSATLSRQMMEADPANVAFCPYVIFIYERASAVNEIVVGYRRLQEDAGTRGKPVLAEINTLLDGIAKKAAGQ